MLKVVRATMPPNTSLVLENIHYAGQYWVGGIDNGFGIALFPPLHDASLFRMGVEAVLTIPETISLHRATRKRYMHAARMAWHDANFVRTGNHRTAWWRGDRIQKMLAARVELNPLGALRCFLRHARAANRKLVQVKRLQRALAAPNNWDGWI